MLCRMPSNQVPNLSSSRSVYLSITSSTFISCFPVAQASLCVPKKLGAWASSLVEAVSKKFLHLMLVEGLKGFEKEVSQSETGKCGMNR